MKKIRFNISFLTVFGGSPDPQGAASDTCDLHCKGEGGIRVVARCVHACPSVDDLEGPGSGIPRSTADLELYFKLLMIHLFLWRQNIPSSSWAAQSSTPSRNSRVCDNVCEKKEWKREQQAEICTLRPTYPPSQITCCVNAEVELSSTGARSGFNFSFLQMVGSIRAGMETEATSRNLQVLITTLPRR